MNREEIKFLAKLSYINLTETEEREFEDQLKEIILHIEETMSKIDLSEISKDAFNKKKMDIMRIDETYKWTREDVMFNAKRVKNGYVLVPKIIKGEE